MTESGDESNISRVAEKIRTLLSQPFDIEGDTIILGASIGVSLFPDDGGDIETLIKRADAAMYVAKEAGKNRVALHSSPESLAK